LKNFIFKYIFVLMVFFSHLFSATIVFESFDDREYDAPLSIFNKDSTGSGGGYNIVFSSNPAISGWSIQADHAQSGFSVVGILSDLESFLDEGLYIRYWIRYSTNYSFPEDQGEFDNVKMLKFAGTGEFGYPDLEFIYKSSGNGGPSGLQLVWDTESGQTGGTGISSVSIGQTMSKDSWHKIEVYMEVPNSGNSSLHVQINDFDVYLTDDADIKAPASLYTGTKQFLSIRASNHPPPGQGLWWLENITIVHNEGNLCNSEPPEPSGNIELPPSKPSGLKVSK
jgi:hypothetical protein